VNIKRYVQESTSFKYKQSCKVSEKARLHSDLRHRGTNLKVGHFILTIEVKEGRDTTDWTEGTAASSSISDATRFTEICGEQGTDSFVCLL